MKTAVTAIRAAVRAVDTTQKNSWLFVFLVCMSGGRKDARCGVYKCEGFRGFSGYGMGIAIEIESPRQP